MPVPGTARYAEMFDYLSAPALPTNPEPAVVFGRADPIVAHRAGALAAESLVTIMVITGGIGKDSGDIVQEGFRSEAEFLDRQLFADSFRKDYPLPPIALEKKAKHGEQNARFSTAILARSSANLRSVTAVAHATSSLRLAGSLERAVLDKTGVRPTVHRAPSHYNFDASNPGDQREAALELLRIAKWPEQNLLLPRDDLPENLVDFALDQYEVPAAAPSDLMTSMLNMLSPRLQIAILKHKAGIKK